MSEIIKIGNCKEFTSVGLRVWWLTEAIETLGENQRIIHNQLTRIADSLEKATCQNCCNTAGETIIKENENEKE